MQRDALSEDNEDHASVPRWVWALGSVVVAACAVWPAIVLGVTRPSEAGLEEFGQFGDAFAPVTGLASALAFVAATVAVLLQSKELALQRRELQLTRDEMRQQREAAQQQAVALEGQIEVQERLAAAQEQLAAAQRDDTAAAASSAARSAEIQSFEIMLRLLEYEAQLKALYLGDDHGTKLWAMRQESRVTGLAGRFKARFGDPLDGSQGK